MASTFSQHHPAEREKVDASDAFHFIHAVDIVFNG